MTATMTTAALAEEIGTTPRELRKFLRSDSSGVEKVGKGGRYSLPATKRDIARFTKLYLAWDDARNAANSDNADDAVESDETTESD